MDLKTIASIALLRKQADNDSYATMGGPSAVAPGAQVKTESPFASQTKPSNTMGCSTVDPKPGQALKCAKAGINLQANGNTSMPKAGKTSWFAGNEFGQNDSKEAREAELRRVLALNKQEDADKAKARQDAILRQAKATQSQAPNQLGNSPVGPRPMPANFPLPGEPWKCPNCK